MFNLKRKQQAKSGGVKKSKISCRSFGDSSSSDEELDTETKFLNSMKKKSEKINTQVQQQDDKNTQSLVDKLDDPKKDFKVTDNEGPRYMKTLIETNKKRKLEQKVMKYEAIDKKIMGKDVFVYESNEYMKEKDFVLNNNNDEDEADNVRDDVLFFNNIINSRLGDNEKSVSESPRSIGNFTLSSSEKNHINNENTYNLSEKNKYVDTMNPGKNTKLSKTVFEAKIRDYVKSKVASEQLEEYKARYWERIKLKITL